MNSIFVQNNRKSDLLLKSLIYLSTIITMMILIIIVGYIFMKGIPSFKIEYLYQTTSILKDTIGILPNIINTLYMILLTLCIVLPISVGGAIYINEYASNKKLIKIITFTTEVLAGIPSIIYGLFGLLFFNQFLKIGYSILSGALTLSLMVLPIICRNTQVALQCVPKSYREAALGMGATKWYMIKTVLLPSSISGILTGIILAVGRIVAESAALLYTAGSVSDLPFNYLTHIFSSGGTLTIQLYLEVAKANYNIAFVIALILILIVFALNMLMKKMTKKYDINKVV